MAGRRLSIAALSLLAFVALLAAASGCAAEEEKVVSTAGDRTALRLTVYARGSALVEEARRLKLPAAGSLTWRDVPKTLNATSLQLTGPSGLRVLEERFRYDPPTHERLLKAARGEKVVLVETIEETGQERRTEAVVVASEGQPVFKIGDEIHLGHPGRVVLPRLPAGLALEPEIVWAVEAAPGEARLTARYLAGGLSWSADYVLLINEADLRGTLSGAFTLSNSSGTDFTNARLQLVAGEVRREAAPRQAYMLKMESAMADRTEQAPVADLHRYTVDGPVSLPDSRSVRLGFLSSDTLKLDRRYEVRGGWLRLTGRYSDEEKLPVAVVWLLDNTEEAGLGRPLPAGTVRVYVAQGERPLLLAGEVPISHTPAGTEEVKLETGEAFDFVAKRRQTEFRKLSKELSESAWKVRVENKKSQDVAVRLVERVQAQAEVVSSSHKPERPSADRLVFNVSVPAGGSVEVAYRIRLRR
jgi:hypothetical protein